MILLGCQRYSWALTFAVRIKKPNKPFNPRMTSICSLLSPCHSWGKYDGHENRGNAHQYKKLLVVKNISLSEPYKMKREQWGE